MALTPWQQDRARFDAGKDLANKKRQYAQLATTLRGLIESAANGRSEQAGVLTPTELDRLRAALPLIERVVASFERDTKAAKRVKADYDARCQATSQALHGLVQDKIADTIALYAVALPRDHAALNDLRAEIAHSPRSWTWRIDQMLRDAVSELTYRMVRQEASPAAQCAALAPQLDAARETHAELIARVKACAVADRLQGAA